MAQYTEEQVKDVEGREAKALEMLKELELTPAAFCQKTNIGNDVFVDKITCYLQDTKFAEKVETPKEGVEAPKVEPKKK